MSFNPYGIFKIFEDVKMRHQNQWTGSWLTFFQYKEAENILTIINKK